VIALWLACAIEPQPSARLGPFYDDAPEISGLELQCGDDRWGLSLSTAGWTGGAQLWIAQGPELVEVHGFASDLADDQGAWDCLSLDLQAVADPTEVAPGATTRFRCSDAAELSFQVVVADPRGESWSDCRVWGADPELWADQVAEDPGCALVLEEGSAVDETCP
jgi:hypothetical protein